MTPSELQALLARLLMNRRVTMLRMTGVVTAVTVLDPEDRHYSDHDMAIRMDVDGGDEKWAVLNSEHVADVYEHRTPSGASVMIRRTDSRLMEILLEE